MKESFCDLTSALVPPTTLYRRGGLLQFRSFAAQARARVQGPTQDTSLAFTDLFDQEARTQLTPAAIVDQLDRFIVVCGCMLN